MFRPRPLPRLTIPSNDLRPSLTPAFARVAGQDFQTAVSQLCRDNASMRDGLTLMPDYHGVNCWMQHSGQAGFAVTQDFELTNVFSLALGQGTRAVEHAQSQHDYLHLNCYEGSLEGFYTRHGFREMHREANWYGSVATPLPDVVYMAWERK